MIDGVELILECRILSSFHIRGGRYKIASKADLRLSISYERVIASLTDKVYLSRFRFLQLVQSKVVS